MEIKRDRYLNQLISYMWDGQVKVITGIRRCGKSYLLRTLFRKHLLASGVDDSHILSFELDLAKDIKYRNPIVLAKHVRSIVEGNSEQFYLFVDEIHRLKPAIEEMLYIAMEDYELDWIIGQGAAARTVRIPIPKFTLVGATTKAGMVSSPLISRFGIVERFSFYSPEELSAIIQRSAGILGVTVESDASLLMASCARGTPRVANRILRRMRDFAQVAGSFVEGVTNITKKIVEEGLKRLEIDNLGLERYDREILLSIIQNYGGGPVGAETLAISIGESMDTLEDYYEPYLIQSGLIQRTPRGRMVTEKAYAHLGISFGGRGGNPVKSEISLFD